MSAASVDLEIEQGAYWRQSFTYQDSNGDPIPLAGFEAQMQMRARPASSAPAATLASAGAPVQPGSEPSGTVTLGDADGSILLEMAADNTSALSPQDYVYDLDLVPPDGKIVRLIKGRVSVSSAVTRNA